MSRVARGKDGTFWRNLLTTFFHQMIIDQPPTAWSGQKSCEAWLRTTDLIRSDLDG